MASNPPKVHFTYGIRDFYSSYRKKAKKSKFPVREYSKYRSFMYDILSEIFKTIVETGWHFVLPYGLGEFYIKKRKGDSVDIRESIAQRKRVLHINNHTMRESYAFKWDKTYASFLNSKYYNFKIVHGKHALHKKYGVGAMAISNFYDRVNSTPGLKMPPRYSKPYNKPSSIPNG